MKNKKAFVSCTSTNWW